MNKFLEKLRSAEIKIHNAMEFESYDEYEEYQVNLESKQHILKIIIDAKLVLKKKDFEEILEKSLQILSSNTGCAEDLDILESILDLLLDKNIITEKKYKDTVNKSSAGRWL